MSSFPGTSQPLPAGGSARLARLGAFHRTQGASPMFSPKLTKYVAAGGAVAVIAAGGLSIGNSVSGNGMSGTATAAQGAGPTQAPAQVATSGQLPPHWRPGTGTIITGAAADKAAAV